MSDSDEITWEKEHIPKRDFLYYRVHKMWMRNGELMPGVFQERENGERGMSTDWSKYSTPKQTQHRAKKPEMNGVIHFVVQDIRNIPLEVVHSPIMEHPEPRLSFNRAHTNVKGINERIENDPEVRVKLMDIFMWEIEVPT